MRHSARPGRVDRFVYAASTVVVLVVVGAAVVLESRPAASEPAAQVRIDGAEVHHGERYVAWTLENRSGADLERVTLAITAGDDPPVEQEVDYLPRGSRRHGVAVVPADAGTPAIRITSWRLP